MLGIDIAHTYQNLWNDRCFISGDLICLILAYKMVETRFLSMQSPDHLPFENRNVVRKSNYVFYIIWKAISYVMSSLYIFPSVILINLFCRFCNILKYLFSGLLYIVHFSEVYIWMTLDSFGILFSLQFRNGSLVDRKPLSKCFFSKCLN